MPAIHRLQPIDDPNIWLHSPMYEAPLPAEQVARHQRTIDDIYGTARGGEPIIKLVWNGDRRYWHELFMSWDVTGKPNAPAVKRPRVRHKALRDKFNNIERDVFPPRWLLLIRLEPEQYPNYTRESWVWDPGVNRPKCIRPDVPPPVYWLWFATIAAHNDHCCTTAEKNKYKCYGKYAPPEHAYDLIRMQKKSDIDNNVKRNPYEKLDPSMIRIVEATCNGYEYEIQQLKIHAEIFDDNPFALIGPKLAIKRGIRSMKDGRKLVRDYFDKKLQEAGRNKPDRS